MPSNRCAGRTAVVVDVRHPMARSFIMPSRRAVNMREVVAERFEIMPEQALPASDPLVVARREQIKVELAMKDEAELETTMCFMCDLPQNREMVVCGRCVLCCGAVLFL